MKLNSIANNVIININAKYFLFLFLYNNTDKIINNIVIPKTICLVPNIGIKKNPAKNVPNILPIVDKEETLPRYFPNIFEFFIF